MPSMLTQQRAEIGIFAQVGVELVGLLARHAAAGLVEERPCGGLVARAQLDAGALEGDAGAVAELALALLEDAASVVDVTRVPGAPAVLPRRRRERPRAAEAQDGGPRLEGDRVAVHSGVGDEDVRAGGGVEALAVER